MATGKLCPRIHIPFADAHGTSLDFTESRTSVRSIRINQNEDPNSTGS
ncbi:hypothetical protein FGIG_07665 [Fasciola gigantica]|uniref:Uncharacterized protein n=1 Tax=Fasciola gigantica TaxID=46835 RepID=A0A504Y8D5_FASGI|nr:hypothetical protein FGIG_07665 [Fasciola gigantica]